MNPSEQHEERLAVYIDHENVAIGARSVGLRFDPKPLTEALAERGRLITRRAYADWNLFREDRRGMVDANVELIEIPQRSDSVRKNAADIQMAVDAMELALTRDFVSTFVIVSGDSDFTPLVGKLRELNKRVIGVGVKGSTSAMLPGSCDEFLFYDRLEGVPRLEGRSSGSTPGRTGRAKKGSGSRRGGSGGGGGGPVEAPGMAARPDGDVAAPGDATGVESPEQDLKALERLVTRTLSGLQSSSTDGVVLSSNLKRALLRKDPTFAEQDYGFRGFREMMRHLAEQKVLVLTEGSAPGDPQVDFATRTDDVDEAFEVLRATVAELMVELGGDPPLSGLKDQVRKRQPGFSEKDLGYSGFLQFCKAAVARGVLHMDWEQDDEEYYLYVPESAER
jgi:uncharacterized protein (TIGR00288 family)